MKYFVLNEHGQPVASDCLNWTIWANSSQRQVARFEQGPILVLTLFFGNVFRLDSTAPSLFETLLYTEYDAGVVCSYKNWRAAEAGHARVVRHVLATNKADAVLDLNSIAQKVGLFNSVAMITDSAVLASGNYSSRLSQAV